MSSPNSKSRAMDCRWSANTTSVSHHAELVDLTQDEDIDDDDDDDEYQYVLQYSAAVLPNHSNAENLGVTVIAAKSDHEEEDRKPAARTATATAAPVPLATTTTQPWMGHNNDDDDDDDDDSWIDGVRNDSNSDDDAAVLLESSRHPPPNEEHDLALAWQLQSDSWIEAAKNYPDSSDEDVVVVLLENRRQRDEEQDLVLAQQLQSEEEQLAASHQLAQQEAEQSMLSSTTGKAWKFVAEVLDLHKKLSSTTHNTSTSATSVDATGTASNTIAPVAVDDLVFTAERMIQAQAQFRAEGRPFSVDIGYHYTRSECLSSIQQDGLMSRPERDSKNVTNVRFNGASYGDGIYTAKDVSTVHGSYGDIGLLVARLKGNVALAPQGNQYSCNNNSVLVAANDKNEERFLVLQKSCQCIPLIQFPTNLVVAFQPDQPGNKIVHEHHVHLQHLCDSFFNDSNRTVVEAPSSLQMVSGAVAAGAAGSVAAALAQQMAALQQQSQALMQQSQQNLAAAQQRNQALMQQSQQRLAAVQQRSQALVQQSQQRMAALLQKSLLQQQQMQMQMQQIIQQQMHHPNKSRQRTSAAVQLFAAAASTSSSAQNRPAQPNATSVHLSSNASGMRHSDTGSSSQTSRATRSQTLALAAASAAATAYAMSTVSSPSTHRRMVRARRPVRHSSLPSAIGAHPSHSLVAGMPQTNMMGRVAATSAPAQQSFSRGSHAQTALPTFHVPVAAAAPRHFSSDAEEIQYIAPETLASNDPLYGSVRQISTDDCPICLDSLSHTRDSVVGLNICGHQYHLKCIQGALHHSRTCPSCRVPVGKPLGTMPSGTMQVTLSRSKCTGYESAAGSIVIEYRMPSGIQKSYHPSPGQYYSGTFRMAYLPDTSEGRHLLKRLKFAFAHGLTFLVGTSLTTGASNSVTWSSIHHKTCLSGGTHGFPDSNFFYNCNEELNAANVPAANDL